MPASAWAGADRPEYLDEEVELVWATCETGRGLAESLARSGCGLSFCRRVGVGQSMYAVAEYTEVNNRAQRFCWRR